MDDLRQACAEVAARARSVQIQTAAIAAYAAALDCAAIAPPPGRQAPVAAERERRAAHALILDAINFGSGWFPTLRKRAGLSGYRTVAAGLQAEFDRREPWNARELATLDAPALAAVLAQDPGHELMGLYAASLNDLGRRLIGEHDGAFTALVDAAAGSAVALARTLGAWPCFADRSPYEELEVPFLKRAQIAAADLVLAGAAQFSDLDRLTLFADNLVPHVLRLDGILVCDSGLVARIDAGELLVHDAPEEVELRACALHAVELIVAARHAAGRPLRAADVDMCLWERGGGPRYKASPRPRSRCTAY